MIHNTPDRIVDRVVERTEGRRKGAMHCQAPSCQKATREGKPYCTKHVHMNPHAARVQAELAQFEKECARKYVPQGLLTDEIVSTLRHQHHGQASESRLARDLNLPIDVVRRAVAALERRKKVVREVRSRGGPVVKIREEDEGVQNVA